MATAMKGVEALQKELEKTKDSLKDVDETIKKLTGRDPTEMRPGQQRRRSMGDESRGRGRLFGAARRTLVSENSPGTPGRGARRGGAFSRLGARVVASPLQPHQRPDSGDEEDLPNKLTVQSSVVATPKDMQSREDLLNAEVKDEKSRTRNRRMFGLLLGTLQRFQTDEKKMEDKEAQRKAVEDKLEEKARQEKKNLAQERQKLFNERKRKQLHLRRLEHKMELVAINEEWEEQTKMLMHFIRTKAKPHVYFLPKRQHANSDKKLRETRKILQEAIEERRRQLESEIEEIMAQEEEELDEMKEAAEVKEELSVSEESRQRRVVLDNGDEEMDGQEDPGDREVELTGQKEEPSHPEVELRNGEVGDRIADASELERHGEMDYEEDVEEEDTEVQTEERGVTKAASSDEEAGDSGGDNKIGDSKTAENTNPSEAAEEVDPDGDPLKDTSQYVDTKTKVRPMSEEKESLEREPQSREGKKKEKTKHRESSGDRERERRKSEREGSGERERERRKGERETSGERERKKGERETSGERERKRGERETSVDRERERRKIDRDDRKRRRGDSQERRVDRDSKKRRSSRDKSDERRDKTRDRRHKSREGRDRSVNRHDRSKARRDRSRDQRNRSRLDRSRDKWDRSRDRRDRSKDRSKERRDRSTERGRDNKLSPRRSDDIQTRRLSRSWSNDSSVKKSDFKRTEKTEGIPKEGSSSSESSESENELPEKKWVDMKDIHKVPYPHSSNGAATAVTEAGNNDRTDDSERKIKKSKGRWDMLADEDTKMVPQVSLADIALPP